MKKVLAMITTVLVVFSLTVTISAMEFSDSNKGIEIVYGEFTGFLFSESGVSTQIDTSKIAAVKFYIKCPDLENIDEALVLLAFNSGTTSWVQEEHDLNEGLIVEIPVPEVVTGDYFEAGLSTWNESVQGTFSVEILDANGDVLGNPVYDNSTTTSAEATTTPGITTPETTTATTSTTAATLITAITSVSTTTSPATGSVQVITSTVMTVISVLAIATFRKKQKSE